MKKAAGTLAVIMLFVLPTEATWQAIGIYAGWVAVAAMLLAYAGAFGRRGPGRRQGSAKQFRK
jgi:hypothetical protein